MNNWHKAKTLVLTAVSLILLVFTVSCENPGDVFSSVPSDGATSTVDVETEVAKETIVFSDLNWTSAQVQNRIAQYILEHGYGYPTDVILGATLPNFQGLQKGDIHVSMEIWLPNQDLGWEKAVEIGDVVGVGTSLVGDWQSTFVIPRYIAEAHPDLQTPQDLLKPEYQELFSTPDSRGKARLVACVIGWVLRNGQCPADRVLWSVGGPARNQSWIPGSHVC